MDESVEELELTYDFICLCCGGRNGELHPSCSVQSYETTEGSYDFEAWFSSRSYLGAAIVPADYVVSADHLSLLRNLAAGTKPSVEGGPRLYQTIMCDANIGHVARLPAYNYRQFDN